MPRRSPIPAAVRAPDAKARARIAATFIRAWRPGKHHTRAFEATLEGDDADEVAIALLRMLPRSPALAANFDRVLNAASMTRVLHEKGKLPADLQHRLPADLRPAVVLPPAPALLPLGDLAAGTA